MPNNPNPELTWRLKQATKPATKLQVLARERNWAILQIKGACGNLQQISNRFDLPYDFKSIEADMIVRVIKLWEIKKSLLEMEAHSKLDLVLDQKDIEP